MQKSLSYMRMRYWPNLVKSSEEELKEHQEKLAEYEEKLKEEIEAYEKKRKEIMDEYAEKMKAAAEELELPQYPGCKWQSRASTAYFY